MPNPSSAIVEPQTVVRLGVSLRDDCGNLLQTDVSRLEVTVGFDQLLPRVEQSILGLPLGGKCTLTLPPGEAFGEYDEDKLIEFDRDEFPPDIAAGDLFDVEAEDGSVTTLAILEVHEDFVLADLNHLLAGKCVAIEFEVLSIRPVSKSDLEAMAIARENRSSATSDDLLPLNRLLRGRPER